MRLLSRFFILINSFIKYKILRKRTGYVKSKWSGEKYSYLLGYSTTHYFLVVGDGNFWRDIRVSRAKFASTPITSWFDDVDLE